MQEATIDLPEHLLLPVLRGEAESAQTFEALKPVNPDGVPMPVAFTCTDTFSAFLREVALDPLLVRAVEVPTADLLSQLAAGDESELTLDPTSPGERVLRYTGPGAVTRRPVAERESVEIGVPDKPLDAAHIAGLQKVAAELPGIDEVWLMEVAITESAETPASRRPLLVVRQSLSPLDDAFHDTFMELGDRWCDTLPRGTAVDMLPHDAPPVADNLNAACRVYLRDGATPWEPAATETAHQCQCQPSP